MEIAGRFFAVEVACKFGVRVCGVLLHWRGLCESFAVQVACGFVFWCLWGVFAKEVVCESFANAPGVKFAFGLRVGVHTMGMEAISFCCNFFKFLEAVRPTTTLFCFVAQVPLLLDLFICRPDIVFISAGA
jgi:hypothetical protein